MVNSKTIFNTLYSFTCFGARRPDLDGPDMYFRIKVQEPHPH